MGTGSKQETKKGSNSEKAWDAKKSNIVLNNPGENVFDSKSEILRVNALDTLRGYCVLIMVAWHFFFFLKAGMIETNFFIFWVLNIIGVAGNPIFVIVMGASLVLSIERREKKGKGFRDNIIHLSKRALIFLAVHHIMIVSYLLYFGVLVFQMRGLYPGWIPSLGINAIICFLLMKAKKLYRIFVMFGIKMGLYTGLLIYIGIEYSSLFYMIFGTIIGDLIIEARASNNLSSFQKRIFITGLILFIIGIPSEYLIYHTYDLTIPNIDVINNPFFTIYALGMFLLSFSILFWIQDYNKSRVIQPINIFSSLSLTLYYIHYVIGTNFFMPFGFGNQFSVYSYTLFLICFYVVVYLIGVIWSKSGNKYSLEWIVRRFS